MLLHLFFPKKLEIFCVTEDNQSRLRKVSAQKSFSLHWIFFDMLNTVQVSITMKLLRLKCHGNYKFFAISINLLNQNFRGTQKKRWDYGKGKLWIFLANLDKYLHKEALDNKFRISFLIIYQTKALQNIFQGFFRKSFPLQTGQTD